MLYIVKCMTNRGYDKVFFCSLSLFSLVLSKEIIDYSDTNFVEYLTLSIGKNDNLLVILHKEKERIILLDLPTYDYCDEIDKVLQNFGNY